MPKHTNINDVRRAIQFYIAACDCPPVLTSSTMEFMTTALTDFIEGTVQKFIAGQLEHGGDLLDRDTFKDMGEELKDFFWYYAATKRQQTKPKQNT